MSRNTITAIHCRAPSRRSLGFTLIELMIAVAIVGILAGIAYPAYNDAIRKSRRAQAKADLAELSQRAERWYTAKNSYAGFFAKSRRTIWTTRRATGPVPRPSMRSRATVGPTPPTTPSC